MIANKVIGGFIAALASCFLLGGAAFAADDMIEPDAGGIPMYSGGVGDDDLSYIKSIEHEYDLKITFVETNGVFLADLPVSIRNARGQEVVNTVTKGPILLVNLPAGNYTVSAMREGLNREAKVSIRPHSLRSIDFRFPGNDMRSPQ